MNLVLKVFILKKNINIIKDEFCFENIFIYFNIKIF